jgi:hypothetical protein
VTTVNVRLTNGEGDPALGSLWLSPTSRHEDGTVVTTTAEYEVPLNGTALTVIAMAATMPSWCWQVREALHGGGGITRIVAVPADSGAPIEYGDLVDVDPTTLSPNSVPEAAWWTALATASYSGLTEDVTYPGLYTPGSSGGGGGGGGGTVPDGYVTNVKVNGAANISLDKTADSATRLAMTSAQVTKLAGIAAGATVNQSDATTNNAIALKATIASPTFTGTVTVPTPTTSGGAARKADVDTVAAAAVGFRIYRTSGGWDARPSAPTVVLAIGGSAAPSDAHSADLWFAGPSF